MRPMKAVRINLGRNSQPVAIVVDDLDGIDNPDSSRIYERDAVALFEVLMNSLPDGIYDKLCDMLQREWARYAREWNEVWVCPGCGYRMHRPLGLEHRCPECAYSMDRVEHHAG